METLYLQPTQLASPEVKSRVGKTTKRKKTQKNILGFLSDYVDVRDRNQTTILNTCQLEDVKRHRQLNELLGCRQKNIVNLHRINDIRRVNKFFEEINESLPQDGVFIGCVETKALRKQRILAKYPPVLNRMYYAADFIFKRIFPKIPILKNIYFNVTNGRNRVITSVETLGRLYSCGFKVVDLQRTPKLLFFIAKKVKSPDFNLEPSYGPLFRMKRIGKDGKIIRVYKMRTMHPYAEYLQEYIYERNRLSEGGKFKDDIRVTTLGKMCRKFWLDELPMLLNLLKGEIKLVGVRPLSNHYMSLYTQELRDLRRAVKPGLIPPFYADMPKTLEDIMDSEIRYIRSYQQNPWKTDWQYLRKACYNIFVKKARSQ